MKSHKEIEGGSNANSTQAARTFSSSAMPRHFFGTVTLDVHRVSGGAKRSCLKNASQSFMSLSTEKFLTPHHFGAPPSSGISTLLCLRLTASLVSIWLNTAC